LFLEDPEKGLVSVGPKDTINPEVRYHIVHQSA
jgi:hypothetical protein